MNKKGNVGFCLLLVVVFLCSACSSKRDMTKVNWNTFTANQLIKEVRNNELKYNTLQAKFNAKLTYDNNDFNMRGQLRMKTDSVIWMSLSVMLGIEVIRVKITSDSVFMINRTKNQYLTAALDSFRDDFPFIESVGFIQDVLLGNDTQLEKGGDFKVSTGEDCYYLISNKKYKKSVKNNDDDKIMIKSVKIHPELFKIMAYEIKEYNEEKIKIDIGYSDFMNIYEHRMPLRVKLDVNGPVQLKMNIEYSNVVIDNDVEFNFNVPKKYERLYKW